jgi:ABC-type Na+ transport system ATPase subunit NatA
MRDFDQLKTMLKRNTILQIRSPITTLVQAFFSPLVISILLFVLQLADTANQLKSDPYPVLGALPGVLPCEPSPCVTLMFTNPPSSVDYSKIMSTFATKNRERTGRSLKLEPALTSVAPLSASLDIVPVPSADFIYDYAIKFPNTTAWGVVFNQPARPGPTNIQYQIWFNATNTANKTDIFGRTVLSLMRGLDEAIISVLNDPDVKIIHEMDINLKDWPLLAPPSTSDAVVQTVGPVFFFCSEMIIFIAVLNTIVTEKELKLRHGMEVMGLKPYIYWVSHFLSYTLLVFSNALFTCIWGLAFDFEAFRRANFFVNFFTFFLFGEAMVIFGFFLSTMVRQSRVAILLGIFVFIIGLVVQTFVFSSATLGYIWWSPETIEQIVWKVLIFLPFFNFGRMFLDITQLTTGKLDALTNTYIEGPGFPWANLTEPITTDLLPLYSGAYPQLTTPVHSFYYWIMNCALYWALMWVLDKVIPNEFGYSPAAALLTREFWTGSKQSSSLKANLKLWVQRYSLGSNKIELEGDEDSDVLAEREKAMDVEFFPALKVLNLRKVYGKKTAVRNSCFTLDQGKLLAVLGQNGAGKTTTIGMLSGLVPMSQGDALIFNKSVRSQMQEIRSIMGICPQHDILFDELTAREHIALYAGLKGVPSSQISKLVEDRLEKVRLLSVADVRAGTYSGGMKRRLSLVISTIGDPQIIFMDEPTTGMDPVNRRHVWSFIEEFKKERAIVLVNYAYSDNPFYGRSRCAWRPDYHNEQRPNYGNE